MCDLQSAPASWVRVAGAAAVDPWKSCKQLALLLLREEEEEVGDVFGRQPESVIPVAWWL